MHVQGERSPQTVSQKQILQRYQKIALVQIPSSTDRRHKHACYIAL